MTGAAPRRQMGVARRAAGHTQETLAALLGTDRTTVGRWERGLQTPQPSQRRLLAAALGISLDELDHLLESSRRAAFPTARAGDGIDSATVVEPSAGTEGAEHDSSRIFTEIMDLEVAELAATMRPAGVSTAMFDHLERTVCRIHEQFARIPPTELLPIVNKHLRAVVRLLSSGQPIPRRRRLCSIAGHLAGQRAWLMFDLGFTDEAEAWYELALEPAREADDDPLAAWLFGAWSVVAFDRRDCHEALRLLGGARQHANRADDSPVDGWVHALEARAHASLGDTPAARDAICCARQRTWHVADDTYRHGMDVRHGELNIDYYDGSGRLALGDIPAARGAFENALVTQDSGHIKGRAVITLQLAMTYALSNDVDRAVDLAVAAWSIPARQRIGPIAERMHQLRSMLPPTADRSLTGRLGQLPPNTSGQP